MYGETAFLFRGMSEETHRKILEAGREEAYAAGAFLFRRGDPAECFYLLREGRVRLGVGESELLAYVSSAPGDVIGWSSLVENEAYTASAECLGAVKVLKIEKGRLDQILQQDPASGMIFFKHVAALVGRRLVKGYRATLSVHGEREPRPGG
jgi:CRP/FNR family cyclic AMP-dependent transcriptional regulator